MPLCTITTNQPLSSDQQQTVAKKLSQLVSTMLSKPENYVMVEIRGNASLLFAGSNEPCIYVELKSIGLPEQQTSSLSQQLAASLQQQLQVASERIYIEFSNAQRHMWGWNGTTF